MSGLSSRFRFAWFLLVTAILVAGGFMLQLLHAAGQFKTLAPHFDGSCELVAGIPGAEDLTIHPQTGIAYISSADRRALRDGAPARGGIYAYDLTTDSPQFRNLTPDADDDFHPHGIRLYRGDDGRDALFVINHASGRHTIEIYDLVNSTLSHRATLSDPLMVSPNDLVAVGRDRFYFSNDHAHVSGLSRQFEDYLRRSISTIGYYDGSRFREAASGIRFPNGINVSRDRKTLYVASTTGGSVMVFEIDARSGLLDRRASIEIGTGVDNIEIDSSGNLWIGAHPKLLTFVQYTDDASMIAPSQVIRMSAADSNAARVEEVFLSLGEDLSGSSVAAVYGDRLLVGSVMDDGILDCRMN